MNASAFRVAALLAALSSSAAAQYSTAGPRAPFGAPPSSGFSGTQPCTVFDDGTTENALGLTNGGWLAYIQYIDCLASVDEVRAAYGSAMFPPSVSNGRPARIVVWEDTSPDTNPTGGMVHKVTLNTVVSNAGTDILNPYPIAPYVLVNQSGWIGAAVQHSAGEFPAPMDVDNPTPRAWVFGSNTATIDLVNPNNNSLPPASMTGLGFPAAFLLRADGSQTPPQSGTAYCFCTGPAFPGGVCGNPGAAGNGCGNSVNPNGANLLANGTTNPDTVQFVATGVQPNQPGLFFQGLNASGGGNGIIFGDGLRCAGGGVLRLQVVFANSNATAATTVTISTAGGVTPGSGAVRRYQYWYRNPTNSPCGSQFNLTNGWEIVW